jgi:hypothetical protein
MCYRILPVKHKQNLGKPHKRHAQYPGNNQCYGYAFHDFMNVWLVIGFYAVFN